MSCAGQPTLDTWILHHARRLAIPISLHPATPARLPARQGSQGHNGAAFRLACSFAALASCPRHCLPHAALLALPVARTAPARSALRAPLRGEGALTAVSRRHECTRHWQQPGMRCRPGLTQRSGIAGLGLRPRPWRPTLLWRDSFGSLARCASAQTRIGTPCALDGASACLATGAGCRERRAEFPSSLLL